MWKIASYSKRFGNVIALANVTITLEENKVYGLTGANGSGKSTLVKLLTGVLEPDEGKLFKDGEELIIRSPSDARKHGICAAYQDLSLQPELSVADNLLLGIETKRRGGFLNLDKTMHRTRNTLQTMNTNIPVHKTVKSLRPDEKQLVEIAKVLASNPTVAIFDEATSYLVKDQMDELFRTIKELKTRATVVFISHRLTEIFAVCDEAIVLRDGTNVAKINLREAGIDKVVEAMAGKRVMITPSRKQEKPADVSRKEEPFFSVENLKVDQKIPKLSLSVKKGEIVGLAGLVGQGQSVLLRALFGAIPAQGLLELNGRKLSGKCPADFIRWGLVYISGDRTEGIFLSRSIKENIAIIKNAGQRLFAPINDKLERTLANNMVRKLNIECEGITQLARSLSGGNQQKVILARGMTVEPKILLLDDPLKGVDIMSKEDFFKITTELSKERAVLFFSTDVSELLAIASRILVIYEGTIVDEFSGERMREDEILSVAIRGKRSG